MGLPARKLGKRVKPLRSKLTKLLSEPIIIDEHSGPVQISSEIQGGKYVVKFESVCRDTDTDNVGAQADTNLGNDILDTEMGMAMTLREFLDENKCTATERRELLRYFLFIRWMGLMELAK